MTGNRVEVKTPWHLWAVGIFGLLWNSFGVYDYVMSITKGVEYFRTVGMTEDQIVHFQAMPSWMTIVWTVGVWGGFLGCLLLLARSRWAFEVFCASFLGYLVSLIYTYVLVPVPGSDSVMMAMQGLIFVLCVFFIWYSHWMRKAGYLR